MARVTVEDCLDHVDNKFDLTLIASKRGRQLARGANTELDWDNDKPTVVALREIAEGRVSRSILDEPELPPLSNSFDAQQFPEPARENAASDDKQVGKS